MSGPAAGSLDGLPSRRLSRPFSQTPPRLGINHAGALNTDRNDDSVFLVLSPFNRRLSTAGITLSDGSPTKGKVLHCCHLQSFEFVSPSPVNLRVCFSAPLHIRDRPLERPFILSNFCAVFQTRYGHAPLPSRNALICTDSPFPPLSYQKPTESLLRGKETQEA